MDTFLKLKLQDMNSTLESKSSDVSPVYQFHENQLDWNQIPETVSALLIAGNILVYIFAFCGNIAAIIVCARSKFSRSATRFFLISLAISDFVIVNFSIIISLSEILDRLHSWVLGEFMCIISDYVQTFAMMTNGCCLIAIAVDRYLTVVRGLKAPFLSPKCACYCNYIFMILVWVVPMGVVVPMLLVYYHAPFILWKSAEDEENEAISVTNNVTNYFCFKKLEYQSFDMYYHIVLGVMYASLISALVFSYVSILRFVKKNFRRSPGDPRPATSTDNTTSESTSSPSPRMIGNTMPQNRHHRTVRLLGGLMALFLICRIPVWIFLIINTSSKIIPRTKLITSIRHFLFLLSNVKSAVNPFVYAIWNDALRTPNNLNNSSRANSRCCSFCLSSENASKCSITNFRQWCRLGNPKSYDFVRPGKVSSSAPTNIHTFNTGDKDDPAFKSISYWNSKGIYTVDSSA